MPARGDRVTTILVIEDEQAIRQNLLDLLEAEGFEAAGAENGSLMEV